MTFESDYEGLYNTYSGDVVIPETVIHNEKEYTVVGIDQYAFFKCVNLKSVTIPNTVTIIKDWAFYKCTDLTSITIPESVQSIGNTAFESCSSLATVNLPDNDLAIGPDAFLGTAILNDEANWEGDMLYIGKHLIKAKNTYAGEYTVKDGTLTVAGNAFKDCTGLTAVNFPDGLLYIDYNSFSGCTGLTQVVIPSSVTKLGHSCFANCSNIATATIPSSVTSIGVSAFYNCTSLQSLSFYNSAATIGDSAFRNCTALTQIDVDCKIVDKNAFRSCSSLETVNLACDEIMAYAFRDCSSLVNLNLAYRVNTIYPWAFQDCSALQELTIPGNMGLLYYEAFKDCTALTTVNLNATYMANPEANLVYGAVFAGCDNLVNVNIAENVERIPYRLFAGCQGLTEVTIPASCRTLFYNAFANCTNLTTVNFNAANCDFKYNFWTPVSDYDGSIFEGCTKLKNVNVGSGVKKIGSFGFVGCDAIESISLPASVLTLEKAAFANCSGLTSVTLADGITTVADSVFAGCVSLPEIIFPNSVESVGENVFEGCTSLVKGAYSSRIANPFPAITAIEYPEGNHLIENGFVWNDNKVHLFYVPVGQKGDFVLPMVVGFVGENAFTGCSQITSISSEREIAPSMYANSFEGLYETVPLCIRPGELVSYLDTDYWGRFNNILVDGHLSPSRTEYGLVFRMDPVTKEAVMVEVQNHDMTVVTIPQKLSIGENEYKIVSVAPWVLRNMTAMTEVRLPMGLTTIGREAFEGCTGLTSVTLPESMTTIGVGAFRNCTGLTEVTLSNSLELLREEAFQGCSSVETIQFGTGIDFIPVSAFEGCSSLQEVVLPRNVLYVGNAAFRNCSGLKHVNLGCAVYFIGAQAFYGANDIASVRCSASVPPTMDADVFSVFGVPLYVYESLFDAYASGRGNPWANFIMQSLTAINTVTVEGIDEEDEIPVGKAIKLTATIEPANATMPYVFWRSTDQAMATIDTSGNLVLSPDLSNPSILKVASARECQIIAETLYDDGPQSVITLKGDMVTGIETIEVDKLASADRVSNDIYNLQGILLQRDASQADVDALTPGLYIVGGRKVMVK